MNLRSAVKHIPLLGVAACLVGPAATAETGSASRQPVAAAALEATADQNRLASPTVEKLHAALLGIMQSADELGYQGRYDAIDPVVGQTFDLPFMASKSVGRHWKKLLEPDRDRWLGVFVQVINSNYAGRFSDFSGEAFETLGEEPAIHDTRVVRTRLTRPSEEAVQLNYRLREVDGEWRIIDIYLNGTVSELALRRSEYSAVLKRDGFEKLVSTLTNKVASLSQG